MLTKDVGALNRKPEHKKQHFTSQDAGPREVGFAGLRTYRSELTMMQDLVILPEQADHATLQRWGFDLGRKGVACAA